MLELYAMFYLENWNEMFRVAPCLALALGIFCVLIAIYGFATVTYEHRVLLLILEVLLVIAFVIQIVAIFIFLEVKALIDQRLEDNILNKFETSLFDEYGPNDYMTKSWDIIQETYKCCGASGSGDGYRNWYRNENVGLTHVPDSCCVKKTHNCGMNIGMKEDVKGIIFTSSCNQMLQNDMENDVIPMIYVYCAVGVIMLLIEIILIFLLIALIFQITRRRRKQQKLFDNTFEAQV